MSDKCRILIGDSRTALAGLPEKSVRCCVTSPPYWGLRDYGVAGQIGLEPTPEAWVAEMVAVFGQVRRVLADDGTLWVNVGDAYCGGGGFCPDAPSSSTSKSGKYGGLGALRSGGAKPAGDVKPKDLIGLPWMLAFALRADGWYLRSDIIWHKPNPMPESVTDRPTKSHEYIFLFSKSPRYFFDAGAIAEEAIWKPGESSEVERKPGYYSGKCSEVGNGTGRNDSSFKAIRETRNARSVWTIPTQGYSGAHFATFPRELAARCIKAGSQGPGKRCDCDKLIASPIGTGPRESDPSLVVGRAGFDRPRRDDEGTRPITRREQRSYALQLRESPHRSEMKEEAGAAFDHYLRVDNSGARPPSAELLTSWKSRGWLTEPPPCNCPDHPGDLVLDPFLGTGTTIAEALLLGRRGVGVELNPEYAKLAEKRISELCPLFAGNAA